MSRDQDPSQSTSAPGDPASRSSATGEGGAIPNELEALRQQVDAAAQRFQDTGALEALDAQVHALQRITDHPALTDAPPTFQRAAHNRLVLALIDRFNVGGQVSDLEAATRVMQAFVDRLGPTSPKRGGDLASLGVLLSELFRETDDPDAFARLVDVLTEAIADAPEGSPERSLPLATLAEAYRRRYERHGDPADFERAMGLLGDAAAGTDASPGGYRPVHELGLLYLARYRRVMNRHDLDRCITEFRRALALIAPDDQRKLSLANDLAVSLQDRFDRGRDLDDLDEAIRILQDPPGNGAPEADRLKMLSNLGMFYRRRFDHLGRAPDLQRAIASYERILARLERGDDTRPFVLNNLGVALSVRYDKQGALADLDRAQDLLVQAVAETPRQSPLHWERVHNLALVLVQRMARTQAPGDVDRVLEVLEQELPPGYATGTAAAERQAWRAAALAARFRHTGDPRDNEEAIAAGEAALRRLAYEDTGRRRLLDDLGHGLLTRFRQAGDPADLQRALEIFELATDVPAAHWMQLPRQMASLPKGLRTSHEQTGDLRDLEGAIASYRIACQHPDMGDLSGRLAAALDWAGWAAARGKLAEAGEACRHGLELAVRRGRIGFYDDGDAPWASQQLALATRTLEATPQVEPAATVSHALARIGVALSSASRQRCRRLLERLVEEGHGDLVESYRVASHRLRQLDRSSLDPIWHPEKPARRARALAAAWAQLDDVLDTIRSLDPSASDDPILGAGPRAA